MFPMRYSLRACRSFPNFMIDCVRSKERARTDLMAGSVLIRANIRPEKRLCSDDSGVLKNPDRSPMEGGIDLSC